MAVKQNYYSEDLTTTNTTGTTYVDSLSLTFTPDANSRYYLFYSCDVNCNLTRGSANGSGVGTRLFNSTGSTQLNENLIAPYNGAGTNTTSGDWLSSFGMATQNFGASPTSQTYKLQFKNLSSSTTSANVREKTLLAIKQGTNDHYTDVTGGQVTNRVGSYATGASLTFTPNVTGNGKYIALAFSEVDNYSDTSLASIRLSQYNVGDYSSTWTQSASGYSTGTGSGNGLNGICYGNNLFVVAGTSGSTSPGIAYSSDGTTWSFYSPSGINFYLNKIAYSPTLGLYVGVGRAGGLITSTDPTNTAGWTQRTSGFSSGAIMNVVWDIPSAKFYTVGANGRIFASSDGVTWSTTGLATPTTTTTYILYNGASINAIASEGYYMVAVNSVGTIGYTNTSANSWTSISTTATAFNAVAAGENIFVAVGTGKIYTSNSTLNGTAPATWTSQTLPSGWTTSTVINSVVWGNGMWVITAAGGLVATSVDNGVTWIDQSNTFGSQSVNSVCFGKGLFVACGSVASTTTNSIARNTAPVGTQYGTSSILAPETAHADNAAPWCALAEITLSNTSQKFAIEYYSGSSSYPLTVNNSRMFFLKVADFNAEYYAESRTRTATTSTTYVDKVSLAPSTSAAEHIVFSAGQTDLTIGVNTVLGSIRMFDSTANTTREEQQSTQAFSSGTSQNFPFFNVSRVTTGSSNTWKIQMKSGTSSLTTGASEAAIVALQSGGVLTSAATQSAFFGFF